MDTRHRGWLNWASLGAVLALESRSNSAPEHRRWFGVCSKEDAHLFHHQTHKEVTIAGTTRVNDQIRISPVRVIGVDGDQLGILPIETAKESAQELGLDLVEVAPTARPPVCRIMDWGKHQYEQQKQAKEARKRQHTVDVKEVKLRPHTDTHDFEVKLRHARRFLEKGQKVKVTVRYRGREMRRPEQGYELLDKISTELDDLAMVESRSREIMGRQLTMMLAPE